MTNSRTIDPSPIAARGAFGALRAWSLSRSGMLSIAGVAIAAGLAFNWSWLVAAGMAPLLISVLPCVAMCALGLCMMQMTGKGPALGQDDDSTPGTNPAPLRRFEGSGLSEAPISVDARIKPE